ncbi:ATP-binding protein [Croceitalea marina]|uniref:histidine kinase n=1 Tax=Croceitalea marina TaxID=1775166 RepID=A0ABW5MPU7_9FLAO
MIIVQGNRSIVCAIAATILFHFITNAQESVRFQAYGHTPDVINDSLYKALMNTSETNERANLLYHIGNEHQKHGNGDSTIYYGNLINGLVSLKSKELKNIQLNKARGQLLLGKGNYLNGLLDEALKAYIEGTSQTNFSEYEKEHINLKMGLAETYVQKGSYEEAKVIFSELLQNSTDNTIRARSNFYLGTITLQREDIGLAKKYFESTKTILSDMDSPRLKLWVNLSFGRLAAMENKNDHAFTFFENTMADALDQKYFDIYTEAVLDYGKVCTKLEQFQMAEMALSMAYANAMQWNRLELQKKIINSLRITYQKKGDFENAYNLMTQYLRVSNQILEQQNSKAIKEIEIKYQTLQKENQIYELKEEQLAKQSEIERQKTIKKAFLYGFLVLLVPIIALLFVYYQKLQTQSQLNQQQEELNSQKIASLLSSQELELARASLDAQQEERYRIAKQLHDSIGGNLAGIKLQLANLKEDTKFQKEVMAQVNDTYELVRDISHDLVPKKFNQNAFISLLENYINQLEKNSEIEISFSAHPKETVNDLEPKLKVELYQIIQELFTNTIKHAEANSVEAHLNIHDGLFQLIFEDDGKGFELENLRKGIGLKNIENRLHNLNARLMLDSTPNRGTVVTIEIPLKDS